MKLNPVNIYVQLNKNNKPCTITKNLDECFDKMKIMKLWRKLCNTGGCVKDDAIVLFGSHAEFCKTFLIDVGLNLEQNIIVHD